MNGLGVLKTRDNKADLAHGQRIDESLGRALHTHAVHHEGNVRLHHHKLVALGNRPVEDAHRSNDTTILVKIGIENKSLERSVSIALRRRDQENDSLKQIVDTFAGLARNAHGVVGRNGKLIFNLGLHLIGMCARKIDLVDCRDNVKIGVHGERRVGNRLGLNALRSINNEYRAFARREGTRDLVREVNVAGRVDQVELIGFPIVGGIVNANGIALNGDATFALDIHRVEKLCLHVTLIDRIRQLENAVRNRRLTVVDMRDDGEISDM